MHYFGKSLHILNQSDTIFRNFENFGFQQSLKFVNINIFLYLMIGSHSKVIESFIESKKRSYSRKSRDRNIYILGTNCDHRQYCTLNMR